MADELRITSSMQIAWGETPRVVYRSPSQSYTADISGRKGPSPGAVTISVIGTDIDFSQLTLPGPCEFINLEDPDDTSNSYVEFGIYDPEADRFHPLFELAPGEHTNFRFSRNFLEEYEGTDTGTSSNITNNRFRAKAYGDNAEVSINAFET